MTTDPRPRRTGTIFKYAPAKPGETHGHYIVRCSAPDGSRPLFHLDPGPESPEAREAALVAATEISESLWAKGLGAARRKGAKPEPVDSEGMAEWFKAWLAARQRRGYTSTRENDSHYREHIEPLFGPKHVRDWTQDDLRGLTRTLDAKVQNGEIGWKTATNIWGTATKMCKDACTSKHESLRVRADNPATGVEGPDRGARTLKQYLYPSEFLKFVSNSEVPLAWRRSVSLAVYVYPRASELRVLRWEDIDLEHRTVHIHRARDRNTGEEKPTKTAIARRFSIEPSLWPLLEVMHQGSDGQGYIAKLPSERDLARGFRRWLMRAGVTRSELHNGSRTRKAITFHDLRATGLTWMAVRGDDPLKIMQRAGHTDFKTTQGYIREAEAVREGFGDVFPTLPSSILGGPEGDGSDPENQAPSRPDSAVTEELSQLLSQGPQVHEIIARRTGLESRAG